MDRHILNALYDIKNGNYSETCGICHAMTSYFYDTGIQFIPDVVYKRLYCFYEKWPHYSGSKAYPVPHPKGEEIGYDLRKNFWSKRSKYGKLRWDLVNFMIKELEANNG